MKIMDISVQDECYVDKVTPAKERKIKQGQLPIKVATSSNMKTGKKRKLTSPLVECKKSKVVKIAKENVSVDEKDTNVNSNVSQASKKNSDNECVKVKEDIIEIENIDDTLRDKAEATGQRTLKKSVIGKDRKSEERGKKKTSNTLTMFLKKTEKERSVSKPDCLNSSLQDEEANDSCDKDVSMNTSNVKLADTDTLPRNASLCHNSDAEITIASSTDEDKEEQDKPSESKTDSTLDADASPKTPKRERDSDNLKHRKLTPKQQEKKVQSAKKREEREKIRMEKEKKLEEERENRRKEKEERRKEREEKEKAEKEQKLKEKKMKELKRQVEIEQKQKEKEAKEEERRKREEATEEEKRKKEEEKLEAERKKQKAASKFASFFVPKKTETKFFEEENIADAKNFMPFEVKADMKVAPVCRRVLDKKEKSLLEKKLNTGNSTKSELYLDDIKCKRHISRISGKTWLLESKDVILLDEDNEENFNIVGQNTVVDKQRPKLLQFIENRRPPYWGTWRKQSHSINPRNPFLKDTKWFNYEVDSDEEWEEEEPGESLHGSDDEKDEENPEDNEYDVDNEFMVPHGYLSDEEVRADDEDKEDMTPETQKFKLKVLGEQFETERNTKTSRLKPKIIGCIWQGPENTFSENVPPKAIEFLSARRAWVRQIPVVLSFAAEIESTAGADCGTPTQQQGQSSKKSRVPAEALPDLISLIHGNTHAISFLVQEFRAYWSKKNKVGENQFSKAGLKHKIREIGSWMACPEEGPMHLKSCWYVPEDTRRKHLLEELTLPNQWSYSLSPKRKSEIGEVTDKSSEKEEKDKDKKNVPLITQFTKKITQEEMKKQLKAKPGLNTPPTAQQKIPKRATLISVARGERFTKMSRKSLMKNFLIDEAANKDSDNANDEAGSAVKSTEVEEQSDERMDVTASTSSKSKENKNKNKNKNKKLKSKKSKVRTLDKSTPANSSCDDVLVLDDPMDVSGTENKE